jgi:hypothetical protein
MSQQALLDWAGLAPVLLDATGSYTAPLRRIVFVQPLKASASGCVVSIIHNDTVLSRSAAPQCGAHHCALATLCCSVLLDAAMSSTGWHQQ